MDNPSKWLFASILTVFISIVSLGVTALYTSNQKDIMAIKQGLVQKVEQSRVIWVKP